MSEKDNVKKLLTQKLKTISNDEEFILSILVAVKKEEDRKAVIEYIDNGVDVTYENLILLGLTIYEERKKNRYLARNKEGCLCAYDSETHKCVDVIIGTGEDITEEKRKAMIDGD